MTYRTKYKCRYCGELFYDTFTSSENVVLQALSNHDVIRTATHFATDYPENPHYGIGDLIGFEVENKE